MKRWDGGDGGIGEVGEGRGASSNMGEPSGSVRLSEG